LILTACNKDIPVASKEYVFASKPFSENAEEYGTITEMVWNGRALIFTATKTDVPEDPEDYDNYVYHRYIVSMDKNGNVIKQVEILSGTEENNYSSENYTGFSALSGGTVIALMEKNNLVSTTDGYMLPDTQNIIVSLDENLEITELLDITEILKDKVLDSYMFIESMAADEKDNVYLFVNQNVYGINIETGNVFFTRTPADGSFIRGVIKLPDGRAGVIEQKPSDDSVGFKDVLTPIDPTTGSTEPSQNFPVYGMVTAGAAESEFDYYSISDAYIYGFNGDGEIVTVADMLSSGMGNISISPGLMTDSVIVNISSTEFIILATDTISMRKGLFFLTKIDPADVPDKKLISVAGVTQDYYFTDFVKQFNNTNTLYQVNYNMYLSADNDSSARITAMNTDILAGNIPDILLISSELPYGSYIKKGMLSDLYPYLDNDKELSRDDLAGSALRAFETEGKLYSIAPTFTIRTLAGKTSIFGEKPGLTLDEIEAAASKYPDAKLFRDYVTQADFMRNLVYYSMDEYVDFFKGECNFDSPEFIKLLETAKTYPEKYDFQNYSFRDEDNKFAQDKVLLEFLDIRNFRDAVSYGDKGMFGEKTTFLGYPNTAGESGIALMTYSEIAMMSAAKNSDGAWEFIKGYINYPGPPPQPNVISSGNGFFLSNKLNENLAKEAMEDQFYYNENGVKLSYGNTILVAGQMVSAPNNTDADNKIIFDLIDSISTVSRTDTNIWNIVNDDAENFFAGKKSARETAAMIQNRVSTYLEESA
jgi:hypothetical protein